MDFPGRDADYSPIIASALRSRRLVVVVGFVFAFVVGVRVLPDVLFDDAAIMFRYASRIADGHGFTFNDGDRTNGASAPLYTLILAGGSALGVSPERFAAVLGVLSFSTAVALVGAIASRISGRLAAAVGMVTLSSSTAFQNAALSGMESGFAACLGLAALLAGHHRRFRLAGVILGLAIFNRVDALALAIPMLIFAWILDRSAAVRIGSLAAVVAAPWFVFAAFYFGSPLPFSGSQKLFGRVGSASMDHTWLAHAVTGREGIVVFLLALLLPAVVLARLRARRRLGIDRSESSPTRRLAVSTSSWTTWTILSSFAWAALHGAFYSSVNLGAPFPWYATVMFPVLAVGCGVVIGAACHSAIRSLRKPVQTWMSADAVIVVSVATIVCLLGASRLDAGRFTARSVLHGFQPRASRALDATRLEAGRYLEETASANDVVRTCFGWVAYGASSHQIDESCRLNTRKVVGPARWIVESPGPGEVLSVPAHSELVNKFATPKIEGTTGATFVYRTRD